MESRAHLATYVVKEFDVEPLAGKRKHVIWKATIHESGLLAWSLRRVLVPLYEDNMPKTLFEVGRWLRAKSSAVYCNAAAAALRKKKHDIMRCPPETKFSMPDSQDASSEFSITTEGLTSLLCAMTALRRSAEDKDRCFATLCAFLSASVVQLGAPPLDFVGEIDLPSLFCVKMLARMECVPTHKLR